MGLERFLIERWSQFLMTDLVQKRAYFAEYKRVIEGHAGKSDIANDPAAVTAVEQAGVALQEQFVAALKARDELEAAYAQRLAEAADADKGKV